jgi:hypothetical protein
MTGKLVRVFWKVDTGNLDTITLKVTQDTAETLSGVDQDGTMRVIDKRAIDSIVPARTPKQPAQLRF